VKFLSAPALFIAIEQSQNTAAYCAVVAGPAPRRALSVVLAIAAELATYAVVRLAGIGGYRSGRPLAVVLILLVGGGLAFVLTREIDDSSDRAIWLTAAAVLAVTLGIQAASVAPPSKGRIVGQLDTMTLPFFKTRFTSTQGHSWCRPECPSVHRVYSAPPTNVASSLATAFVALSQAGVVPRRPLTRDELVAGIAEVHTNRVDVYVRATRAAAASTAVVPRVRVDILVRTHKR